MRQKKNYMILTFKTTTAAMAMEKKCSEEGIPGRLIPLPGEIMSLDIPVEQTVEVRI